MKNTINKPLDLSNYPDLKDMHEHVCIIIDGSKEKINNTFGPHIDIGERA
jgi:hypothetical protein